LPLRKCMGCNEYKETSHLIRIMKDHKTKKIIINPDSSHFGRSSYLCYNKNCVENAIKRKRIQKTLKSEISTETIEQIKKLTEN